MQDISDRKHAEEALRVSEERYALTVGGAHDALWDWDIEKGVIYTSPRMSEILGIRLPKDMWRPGNFTDTYILTMSNASSARRKPTSGGKANTSNVSFEWRAMTKTLVGSCNEGWRIAIRVAGHTGWRALPRTSPTASGPRTHSRKARNACAR
jgi:PAS domain-containing protein